MLCDYTRCYLHVVIAVTCLCLSACDPNKSLDDAFKEVGLARLRTVRTDVIPGSIIFQGKNRTVISDNVGELSSEPVSIKTDEVPDIFAVVPKLSGDRTIGAKAAVDFLSAALPIKPSGALNLTSSVSVDQIDARISKMSVIQIQSLLAAPGSSLPGFLKAQMQHGSKVFVVFEAWRASTLTLKGQAGQDISADVKVGEVKTVISTASASFSFKKNSSVELKLSGDRFYTFAVKVVKIEAEKGSPNLSAVVTNFSGPSAVKGADDQYVSFPDGMNLDLRAASKLSQ